MKLTDVSVDVENNKVKKMLHTTRKCFKCFSRLLYTWVFTNYTPFLLYESIITYGMPYRDDKI